MKKVVRIVVVVGVIVLVLLVLMTQSRRSRNVAALTVQSRVAGQGRETHFPGIGLPTLARVVQQSRLADHWGEPYHGGVGCSDGTKPSGRRNVKTSPHS